MPGKKTTIKTYQLSCDEHAWFNHTLNFDIKADRLVEEHNEQYHNDPEKEETWPTHP